MTRPANHHGPKPAPPELQVLARFEEFLAWSFGRTARWPKHARFTITQRVQNHLLDTLDDLVVARYVRAERLPRITGINLRLQRIRHLLRLALTNHVCPTATFEAMLSALDETGRMLHGWRRREEALR